MMFSLFRLIGLVCLLFPALTAAVETASNDSLVSLTLTPDQIHVGTFYRGATVDASAQVPECDGAIVIMASEGEGETLNRKGRVVGIWLNVAQVTVRDVPDVYLLGASDKLENICSPEVRQELGLGVDYLRQQLKFTCDKPLTGTEFDEFLRLKSKSGTYNMDIKAELTPAGPGMQEFSAILPVPATIPPGKYEVLLYCFRGGEPVMRGTATLLIEQVGFARLMSDLAHKRAALYGGLAIVIAMVVGVGMGIVFNSMRGAGH
jgi:uncharacterized protein (TIGR02186 family)